MFYPAISFQGNCNEAIEFYKQALGAQVRSISLFGKDAPDDFKDANDLPDDYVMDSEVLIDGQVVMMTDGAVSKPNADAFSMCLIKDTGEEVRRVFDALAKGGKVIDPLNPVFWSSLYGVVEDKFGFQWMIMVKQ